MPKKRTDKETLEQVREWADYWAKFTPPDMTPTEAGWMQAANEVKRLLDGGSAVKSSA